MTFSAIRWAALALCHVVVICSNSKSLSTRFRNNATRCWESRPRWRNLEDETGMISSRSSLFVSYVNWSWINVKNKTVSMLLIHIKAKSYVSNGVGGSVSDYGW